MSKVSLTYVSIFTRDVERLPSSYADVFGLEEVAASRSHRYRELNMGAAMLGFPSADAYATLDLADQAAPTGVRSMLTFAATSPAEVDALTARAVQAGARLVKPGFDTAFGQYLSVVLDPEGNALRISAPTPF
jgi:predicted enzyme related to lactoylglutathione lyase